MCKLANVVNLYKTHFIGNAYSSKLKGFISKYVHDLFTRIEHDLSGSDVYYRVGTKGPLDSCL